MADELTVKVVSGTSENLHVHVDLASASVLSLKQEIEQQNTERFPVSAQRLIFQGQILQDDKSLVDYHVAAGCALHLTLVRSAVSISDREEVGQPKASTGLAPSAQLRTFLQQMHAAEPQEQYATAVHTLQTICANIVDHPSEEKYRKLRVDNAVLKAKLFDRTRGQDSVKLLGYQDSVQAGHLVLVPTPEKWETLIACKAVVDSTALAVSGAAPAAASPAGPRAGLDGRNFASQAQSVLPNPAMLQTLISNPMVQQLAQQHPMLAQVMQNPALLAQSMQAMQQNPAMMQQMTQMMGDPNGLARMMNEGGLGTWNGAGASSPSAAAPLSGGHPVAGSSNPFPSRSATPASTPALAVSPLSVPTAVSSTTSASDEHWDEAYEEDEIALAIARSVQDQ